MIDSRRTINMEKTLPKKVSVLICGDVLGNFKSLFNRISKLLKANNAFEALYCVGSFFGDDNSQWELVKSGKIKVPIPCYILGPCKSEHVTYFPDPNGGELTSNIIYLGKRGILSSNSGMRIAYLSGVEGGNELYNFTAKDITELQDNFQNSGLRGVDFLLTSAWPTNVTEGVSMPQHLRKDYGSDLIPYLAATIKPCYHFAGLEGVYMERVPYRNSKIFSNKASHFTRFIGLGEVANTAGEQFIYGLNHCPLLHVSEKDLLDQKVNEISTECPYRHPAIIPKKAFEKQEHEDKKKKNAFLIRYNPTANICICNTSCYIRVARAFLANRNFQKCWFCLSYPVEQHLIFMIGQSCYLSLAKGWLVPDHFLIVSNVHHSSTATLTEDEMNELHDFKLNIKKYCHSKNKNVVFFERNYKSPHLQLQAVAVPQKLSVNITDVFVRAANENNIPLEEIPPDSVMKQVVGTKKSFFYLELECENGRVRKYLHIIEDEFPIIFPRQVLASESILNVPNRINWRECATDEQEDATLCKKLRMEFRQI